MKNVKNVKNFGLIIWAMLWIALVRVSLRIHNVVSYAMIAGVVGAILFSGEPFQTIPLMVSAILLIGGFVNMYIVDLAHKLNWI